MLQRCVSLKSSYVTSPLPNVRWSWKFCFWIGILCFLSWNSVQGIRNPAYDIKIWKPRSNDKLRNTKSSIWKSESTTWNPELKPYMGRGNANVLECRESRSDVFFARGWGGGVYFRKNWVRVCGTFPKTLTLFQTRSKIWSWPYFRPDL